MKKRSWRVYGGLGLVGILLVTLAIVLIRMNWRPGSSMKVEPRPADDPLGAFNSQSSQLSHLPEDADAVLSRLVACAHWANEDSFDEERRAEIEKKSEDYGCATVFDDRDKILEKYKGNAKVEEAFRNAESGID
jgi:hypothetical protein